MESDNEEYCDAFIDCPHCKEQNHICDLIERGDDGEELPVGGEFNVNCTECKQPYILVENLMVTYETHKSKEFYNN